MRQYWIVRQYRRMLIQPLDFDFELCDLKTHLANFFFHLCDETLLLLLDSLEILNLPGLITGSLHLSFPTPQ